MGRTKQSEIDKCKRQAEKNQRRKQKAKERRARKRGEK